jgi:rhodanese-related sulfurtransferase
MSEQLTHINSSFGTTTPRQVRERQSDTLLLDVRTPAEFEEVHVEGAVLHPLTELNPDHVRQLATGKRGFVLICGSGGRARQAAEKLAASGLSGIQVMSGGMKAWEGEGLPVKRGQKTISLERQVRIAAGSIVFVSSVLAYAVNPAWIALAAFIGAGLVFAGVTDTCGMAMALARMPWNNRRKPANKPGCCSVS